MYFLIENNMKIVKGRSDTDIETNCHIKMVVVEIGVL
jgi:hypothetical protein